MLRSFAPQGAIWGWGMADDGERRFRFEEKTSDIARVIDLPVDRPGSVQFKEALRAFLALLGELARSCWL